MTQGALLASSRYYEELGCYLTPEQFQVLRRATTPKLTKYIIHEPTVPQAAFLLCDCKEAMYGGAAGGGKSDALLMAALQYADVPDYAAIIFRRTYADLSLPGALMDRAREWLENTDAVWSEKEKTWGFPSGATLTFGYLETEKDKYRYQSAAFQYIAFDELTQFTQTQYTYLFSRLRRLTGSNVPLRMRSATNPGGTGHKWVHQRFIVEGKRKGRVFIPAKLQDNPYLDQESYMDTLAELDPVTRAQLAEGNWEIRPAGNMFKQEWFKIVDEAPARVLWVRYWDFAATEAEAGKNPDWTVGVKIGLHNGQWYIADVRRIQATPLGVEKLVKQTAQLDGRRVPIFIEQEPGASGKQTIDHYAREVLAGYAMYASKTRGDKVARARPLSAAAEAGNVILVRGAWITDFIEEATAFPEVAHDDQIDAACGGQANALRIVRAKQKDDTTVTILGE